MKLQIIFLLIILPLFLQSQNPMKAPVSKDRIKALSKDIPNDPIMYTFYKRYVSPIDDDRCIMYPSCSTYAKDAISKHGFIIGFLHTTDRLTRCGNDLFFYKEIFLNNRAYFIDTIYKKEESIYEKKL